MLDHKTKYIVWYIQNTVAVTNAAFKDFVLVSKNKYIQLKAITEYVIPETKPYKAENFKLFLYIQYSNGIKDIHAKMKKLNL